MACRLVIAALSLALLGQFQTSLQAAVTNWTVQSASSSLTLSAIFYYSGVPMDDFQPQGAGSLTTPFSGTLQTQQNFVSPGIPSDIQILAAALDAEVNGNWDPLPGGPTGSAPADYGAESFPDFVAITIVQLAIRNLAFELDSGVLPLSGAPFGTQDFAGNLEVTAMAGVADYRGGGGIGPLLGSGAKTLIGLEGTSLSAGTIAYSGLPGVATLTIPLEFQISIQLTGADTTDLNDDMRVDALFQGSFVATAATESVPEANSLVLLGLAGSVVGFFGYRRRIRLS